MCDKKTEQRVVIKFLVKRGASSAEIMKQLTDVYKDDCLKKTAVYEWAKRFREGRESVEDDSREGAPSTSRTAQNVDRLRVRVLGDRRVSLRMLEDELGINKLCVKWFPKCSQLSRKSFVYPSVKTRFLELRRKEKTGCQMLLPETSLGCSSMTLRPNDRACSGWKRGGGSAPQKPECRNQK
ncbi:unnamed protein product [Callosobruchus maculatus]|uniref:Mos1 transposase HTH domain-containing protein n=1 Tax=Callosobruchus maculatus TaxID=64391 RepID=A0A653BSD1_CALMS|nr:unnamed protein product [Callosobruchus maculatus]